MLQDRQLIELVAAIVQKTFNQYRVDRGAGLFDRLTNDLFALIARQRWNEKLDGADSFGKTLKSGTIADEIRPHGQEQMYVMRLRPAGFEKKLDEFCGLFARLRFLPEVGLLAHAGIRVAEQLLELIHDEQQRNLFEMLDMAQRFGNTEARAFQLEPDALPPRFGNVGIIVLGQACQDFRERAQRCIARMHLCRKPRAAAGVPALLLEQWKQARAYQR